MLEAMNTRERFQEDHSCPEGKKCGCKMQPFEQRYVCLNLSNFPLIPIQGPFFMGHGNFFPGEVQGVTSGLLPQGSLFLGNSRNVGIVRQTQPFMHTDLHARS